MANKLLKEKKKILLLLSIFILFALTLCSCNWFGEGILNVFDPKAQIRVNYTDVKYAEGEGTIDLEIYSINEVEFIGEGFKYRYYNGGTLIPELSKDVGLAFYVAPSDSPGKPGEITKIIDLPLYYQQVADYVTMNPKITEIACTVSLIGTDGAGHNLAKSITIDFPAVQPGVDFEPPNAVITVTPGTSGSAPFTVQFDASQSTDNRGIASYSWDFGDGTAGTGVMPPPHTYVNESSYFVKLTVTDHWGNVGYATTIINVGKVGEGESEVGAPKANIQVTPSTSGTAPFTVAFSGSGSSVSQESGCGGCSIVDYRWDFGDGTIGTGIGTTHTYTEAGTYMVILTVTDSNGKKGYATAVIIVTSEEEPTPVVDKIIVSANPESNVPGGRSIIQALVLDSFGNTVDDEGITVNFITNSGILNLAQADTINGIATVNLKLNDNMESGEKAKVTAYIGSISDDVEITCIDVIVTIYADSYTVAPGDYVTITAVVTDTKGVAVEDDVIVIFYSKDGSGNDIGHLNPVSIHTNQGWATTQLTLFYSGDEAKVTAKCGSRISNIITIKCKS